MQAFANHLKRSVARPAHLERFNLQRSVTTTRYVKVNKKEIVTPPAAKARYEPKTTAAEVSSNKTYTEPKAATPAVATQPQHFPTSDQFDTSSSLEVDQQEEPKEVGHNWSSSFYGLSTEKFPKDVADILLEPVSPEDIEIKPDGLLYLPEIKYRRILNRAFGPGGWGLAPRGEHTISTKNISREYALICSGRFVSQARGEQDYFDVSGLPTASEGCKSNALMRCCKDLGIASELWDPVFIRKFKKKYCTEVWAEHVTTKKKKKLWRKKDDVLEYPYKEN
ncbi:mitochondrial genome maintenance MGM101-domain-containing protein [Mucor lusitanicus]|uniref:Mitochondrial genome maintenance protein MGM101 n=2 Tax=Mucor circinelloides f. lusitanicus TaxID=29924 RepID=A0A162Q488_MUCCL|nr:mitochondrial genome maintenance protein [Mucor lusitanicus]OAC98819.1 hypothetical protein MUCCIDRAFT_191110 [Mucor lusitanicus CBS 277.49]